MGGMVPGDMLRMIEEAANDDPVELQNGFTAYDGCSGKRKLHFYNSKIFNFRRVEYDDECVTASEMYSCGREKEPGLVDIMFKSGKGNATLVYA
jgi:hypothetical protein